MTNVRRGRRYDHDHRRTTHEKGADAANQAAAAATAEKDRRLALNLQAEGFPPTKIAQVMGLAVEEVENLVRPLAS